jgi:hypothetical protein
VSRLGLLGVNGASRPALYGGVIWVVGLSIAYWKFVKGKEIPLTTLAQVGGSKLGKRLGQETRPP